MNAGSLLDRPLSRHQLTRVVGFPFLLMLLFSVALAPVPSVLSGELREEESPEAFLARAYSHRVRAMTFGDPTLLDALYDTANPELLEYEKDRVAYFQNDIGGTNPGKVLTFHSAIRLLEVAGSGSIFKARLYETLSIAWLPGAKELPPLGRGASPAGAPGVADRCLARATRRTPQRHGHPA
ncbi:MAG: hypothetical protein ACYC66_00415 [Chloroflexota bacterium]